VKINERRKLRLTFPSPRLPEVQNDYVFAKKGIEGDLLPAYGGKFEIRSPVVEFWSLLRFDRGCRKQANDEDSGYSPHVGKEVHSVTG